MASLRVVSVSDGAAMGFPASRARRSSDATTVLRSAARAAVTVVVRVLFSVWLLATYLPASTVLILGTVVALATSTGEPRQTGSDSALAEIVAQFAGNPSRLTTERATLERVSVVRRADTADAAVPEDAIELHMKALRLAGVDISSNGQGVRHDYPTTAEGPGPQDVTAVIVINSMDLCLPPRDLERATERAADTTRTEVREIVSAVYARYSTVPLGREGLCVSAAELLPTMELLTSRGLPLSVDAINVDIVLYRFDVATSSGVQDPHRT